jgi:hypothetical protein
MKPVMHVWPQPTERTEPTLTVGARIELNGHPSKTLWYRVPTIYETALSPNSDPFVVAVLLAAMGHARELVIHGSVSPSLLSHLEEFQAAWAAWLPQFLAEIPITVDREQEPNLCRSSPAAIAAFSGGVDSSYTVFSHARALLGRRSQPLKAGLFVHGFDIPLSQVTDFERAAERAGIMLDSLGLTLIPMATNFRQVMSRFISWENSFGSAIAASLLMLQGQFDSGLIPSSYSYHDLAFPYGSNPLTDPLLGNRLFSIRHDGADKGRFGKVQVIKDWPAAMANLRVCWQGDQKDRNCCRCEKCIRNILTFRLVGAGLPPCFEEDVTDQQIRRLRIQGGPLDAMRFLGEAARRQGVKASWVDAVETAVRRSQRHTWLKQKAKRLLQR